MRAMESSDTEERLPVLEADDVYVQMKKQYRVSRYIRAQWFVNHLGKTIQPKQNEEFEEEIEVLSALPKNCLASWSPATCHQFSYLVTPATKVTFLAKKYRFVFCLDLSASIATVDIQNETLLFDEVFPTLEQCIEKMVMPFQVPGSCMTFQPELYITVIACVPHYTPAVQQVLIQGWPLTQDNKKLFLKHVADGLLDISEVLAKATAGVAELHEHIKLQSEKLTGVLFEELEEQAALSSHVNMTPSDVSTLNMLKYGMLALQLLPENSSAGIVVITDGMISLPNSIQLESLLTSLRTSTVACSFFQLGSRYHTKSCLGFVPYDDIMRFIARATFGAFLDTVLHLDDSAEPGSVNVFHKALLFWSFQEESINRRLSLSKGLGPYLDFALAEHGNLEQCQNVQPLRKKNSDGTLSTSLWSILSCKLREGYALRSISTAKGEIEMRLVLPWKFDVDIEYVVTVPWPSRRESLDSSSPQQRPICSYEVYVEASYEFLHDVTCEYFKPNKPRSIYRITVAQQYWNALKNISSTDQFLVHLHSFNQNPAYYTVPDSIRNGVPLFVIPHNGTHPVLSSKSNCAYAQFATFWKLIAVLDINIWQRWMHVHRVGLLLEHDVPLPRHLQQANSSGRYDTVQCRQALNRLAVLLRDTTSFVLVENHSYVGFLHGDADKPPVSFYVIRVTSKAPCMVIRFAFLGGTPGEQRNAIVKSLTDEILGLEFSRRASKGAVSGENGDAVLHSQRPYKKVHCCVQFRKPLERILIRHERVPRDMMSPAAVIAPHDSLVASMGGSRKAGHGNSPGVDPTSQLSRYLHHRRWVWTIQQWPNVPLPLHAVTRVLKMLTKIRLEEGFHFAHSGSGILNLALEIQMKNTMLCDAVKLTLPCVVQYVVFPPHSNTTIRESVSDDEDNEMETAEADGELQLVTECWVEPQCGGVVDCPLLTTYLAEKNYREIPQALYEMDFECIASLITLEHLNLACVKGELACPGSLQPPITPPTTPALDSLGQPTGGRRSTPDLTLSQAGLFQAKPMTPETVVIPVPFSFSIMKLLPKCQQAEALFSTFSLSCPHSKISQETIAALHSRSNELLLEHFLEAMQHLHDRELPLSREEIAMLPLEIYNRPRDVRLHPLPFPPPLSPFGGSLPEWRCFVRSFSGTDVSGNPATNSHVVLTFIPSSYQELLQLMLEGVEGQEGNLLDTQRNMSACVDNANVQLSSTPLLEDRFAYGGPAMQRVEETIQNEKSDGDAEEEQGKPEDPCEAVSIVKQCIALPVYVYDAPVSAVIGRLVYQGGVRKWKDVYLNLSMAQEEQTLPGTDQACQTHRSDDAMSHKTLSPEPRSDDSEFGSDCVMVKKHCPLICKAFSRSFVYSVFRALQEGLTIDAGDINAVVEDMCEESVVTIDITEFLQATCGHTRDFRIKTTVEHTHRAVQEQTDGTLAAEGKEDGTSSLTGERTDSLFPVSLLERHHPCEVVQQLHLSIKQRFQQVLQDIFQPVPSRPDYYYFSPPCKEQCELSARKDKGANQEGELGDWNDVDTDTDKSQNVEFCADADGVEEPVTMMDEAEKRALPEITSLGSRAMGGESSSAASAKSVMGDTEDGQEGDEAMETIREVEPFIPPLFGHLTCLVKTSGAVGTCSLTSLPTCLGEVINCLENSHSMLDLENMKVQLDLLCLTLPPDFETLLTSDLMRSSTYRSSSTVNLDEHSEDDARSIASSSFQVETSRDPLSHLPEFQNQVISKCVEKIKWMLRDELSAAALGNYPLTAVTLRMVTEHVESTSSARSTTRLHAATGAPGCQVERVPLQFVFGPEQSFDKFLQEFKHLSLPSYRLEQADNEFYYLVLDTEASKVTRRQFGSLIPPLGVCSKDLIIPLEPHRQDNTSLEEETSPIRKLSLPEGMRPLSKLSDEDESEGGSGRRQEAFRTRRKQMGRSSRSKIGASLEERASSVPPGGQDEAPPTEVPRKPGQSCPAELLDLKRSLQERQQATHVDNAQPCVMSTETIVQAEDGDDSAPPISPLADSFRERVNSVASSCHGGEVLQVLQYVAPTIKSSGSRTQDSTRSTPNVFSEPDVGGQVSNTEDGYEGDSSESDSDLDWMNTLDTKRPHLPPFWLILSPYPDHVDIFFHMREQPDDSADLRRGLAVFEDVAKMINSICKVVNQMLLLQHLNESRMCNRLLVPEATEDIWSQDTGLDAMNSFQLGYDADLADNQGDYLEATRKFKPGAFDCSVVWANHFSLHPRLNTGTGRTGVSRGLQALRAVLTGFSVNNRKNMFVYQESPGSVFYLRLHEIQCHGKHGQEDDASFSAGSRSSSVLSLAQTQRKTISEPEEDFDFRPRLSSSHSDRDQSHDTISIVSHTSGNRGRPQQCVVMHVHGITQPGFAIKGDLVSAMQNKLDDAVLEVLTTTLGRNPACNLTLDDVQFIQKPHKEPNVQLFCTVHMQLLPYLQAVMEYLRQNLHTYLHTPKYTDPRPEFHLKPYLSQVDHPPCNRDEDIFLFNRFKAMGTPSNGIACIIVSVVDGNGRLVQQLSCPKPTLNTHAGNVAPSEYKDVAFNSSYEAESGTRTPPGPIAMIRFQIWCVGKDYLDQLEKKLENSVRHAFWDVLMEYRLLTCPVTREADDEPASLSEPPTPVKVRRTGRVLAEKMREKPFLMSMFTPRSREMSSSVPDMMEKLKSPRENATEFDFSDALFSDASQFPPLVAHPGGTSLDSEPRDVHKSKKLNSTFHYAMCPFFDGAVSVGVPSVVVHKCCVKARRAVPLVLKELQLGLRNLAPHITLSMFIERSQKSLTQFLLFNPLEKQYMFPERYDDDVPGTQRRYVVIGRNLIQWKAFVGLSDLSAFLDATRGAKSHKSMQLFEPQLLSTSPTHLDRPMEHCISARTPGTPISGPPSGMASPSGEPLKLSEQDLTPPVFVPRQQLLFLIVEDKLLTLYLYNWTSEMSGGLFRLLTQLTEWHNLRRDFLYSAAYQKLGLFFNQPMARNIKDGSAESSSGAIRPQVPHAALGGGATVLGVVTSPAAATNPSALLEHIINRHHPPSRNQETVLSCATRSALSTQVAHVLHNTRPRCPMHKSGYADQDDPVPRHGKQILEVRGLKRKDLIEFNRIYNDKGTCANLLNMEKMLTLVRREARLVHFCQTPLLFNPTWRIRVAQVRDHTLDPHGSSFEGCPVEHNPNQQRARHSSGGSQKSSCEGGRMRRASGAPSMSGQSSPKHRRSANEETWHMTVCSHYIQEYIQYLQNLGFVAIQMKHASSRKTSMVSMRRASRGADVGTAFSKKVVAGSALAAPGAELPRHCLFQWHLGGLYFFEVGFCDPYVFCNLYTVERPRLLSSGTSFYMSQITSEFIEDMDKIRVNMHMHSFTYDYHLRTIHSYVSGQQLLFKHGYHLTSFLDDFVKYYQKSPNYARNLIYAGSVSIGTNTVDPNQLYNYIIGHNKVYGMKVIRMVPVVCDTDADVDTEYALVEISSKKVSYRDANDVQQTDNFFVGILTIQDASPAQIDRKILCLNYYILLTSQRELFPKFTSVGPQVAACSTDGAQDDTNGCFRPVRLPGASSSQPTSRTPSRRSSAVSSHPIERVKSSQQIITSEETNVLVSGASSSSSLHGTGSGTRSRRGSFRGICEEEVAYLGYYSNHETLMQRVMSEQASTVVEHLRNIIRRASLHCRRDYLWKCLTTRSKSSDDPSQGLRESAARLPPISFLEFTELLGFVEMSRLDETDPQLTLFLTMHFGWYQGLWKVLANHYNESISVFHSPDGSKQHVVVTSASCSDSLILLTTNTQAYRADLQIVHRERFPSERTGGEKPHARLCALHPLIEEFVNVCCFHLWTGLLT